MAEGSVRIDLWLWRARFFKTRTGAAAIASQGRIRLRRSGEDVRIDKPSRTVGPGDELTFAVAAHVIAVRVLAVGERRGPAAEARMLYEQLSD